MKLFNKLDNMFAAAAFAEEGEHETARHIVREIEPENINIGFCPAKNGRVA